MNSITKIVEKKEQYFVYFLTFLLNLISFLVVFYFMDAYKEENKYQILPLKISTNVALLIFIFYAYIIKYKELYFQSKCVKFVLFLLEISPFIEIILFITIELFEYLNGNGPFWLIYFRISNFLMKSLVILYDEILLRSHLKKRMILSLLIVIVILNIYGRMPQKSNSAEILVFVIELILLFYTFDRFSKMFISNKEIQKNIYSNFLDYDNEGILIIKAENKEYKIIYNNEKLLNLFNIKKTTSQLNFALFNHEIRNFRFQKIKHRECTFIHTKKDHFNHTLNSLNKILSFYESMNEENDLSLSFLFMRNSCKSYMRSTYPRLRLNLKKNVVSDEFYYYLTFTKMENILSLKEKYEYKNRLLNSFTHEIRTPLNGSIPILQELKAQAKCLSYQHVCAIDNAIVSLKLLENSLNNLTDYSLMSFEQLIINIASIDIEELLGEIFTIVKCQINLKNLNFVVNIDERLLNRKIMTDYNRVKQLILNLLLNSIQFTYSGSINMSIVVTHESPLNVEFTIQDTGIGIEADKLENLKQKLIEGEQNEYQMNSSGSCLGLRMSQKLAILLGKSDLDIESVFGEGTKIKFYVCDQNECDSLTSVDMICNINKGKYHKSSHKNSVSLANQNIIEFSKYVLTFRTKNLDIQKSLKDHSIDQILNDYEEKNNEAMSVNSERKNFNFQTVSDDYDFGKIKEIHCCNLNYNAIQEENLTSKSKSLETLGILETKNTDSHRNETISKIIYSITNTKQIDLEEKNQIQELNEENVRINGNEQKSCQNDKILLVDDDAFNLFSLEMILKSLDFNCEKAMNGKEAINRIKEMRCPNNKNCNCGFKLIFMDYQMPLMNGVETTMEIINMIEQKEIKKVSIIGCTAFTTKDEIMSCLNAGMKDVICKPVSRNIISNIVKQWI